MLCVSVPGLTGELGRWTLGSSLTGSRVGSGIVPGLTGLEARSR